MYHPVQLISFSLMHLEYFLEDLSDDDARERLTKRDGTRMNATNAIRQVLGHPEVEYVRFMGKNMDWLPEGSPAPEWVPYPPAHQIAPDPTAIAARSEFYALATAATKQPDEE
jgi:hypothetical protein